MEYYTQIFQIVLVLVTVVFLVCAFVSKAKNKDDSMRGFYIGVAILSLIIDIALFVAYLWQWSAGWL